MKRMVENEVRAVGNMRVPGKRPKGRPRGRWMDGVRRDMQALRITPEDAQERSSVSHRKGSETGRGAGDESGRRIGYGRDAAYMLYINF